MAGALHALEHGRLPLRSLTVGVDSSVRHELPTFGIATAKRMSVMVAAPAFRAASAAHLCVLLLDNRASFSRDDVVGDLRSTQEIDVHIAFVSAPVLFRSTRTI